MRHILVEGNLERSTWERLEAVPDVRVQYLEAHARPWELQEDLLAEPEVILCKLPPGNLDAMTNLRLIQLTTVGYEHLRDRGFADRSLRVCNARGIFDTAIAEWNIAMMIALARDLRGMLRNQDHGVWERSGRHQQEVRDAVVGLWGYGGIGRETARLAKALGMTVHVLTRQGIRPRENTFVLPGTGDPSGVLPDRAFLEQQKREFLAGLDFLVLALPHTKQSDGMIGEEELRCLPAEAFVLNPARGPIIQEQTLLSALRQRWIAGAGLDTHFAYPLPADHPLWRFPNVILTPHISGADHSRRYPERMAALFVTNVQRYLAGQPLLNELTREEWLEA